MIGVALAEWLCAGERAPTTGAAVRDSGRRQDAAVAAKLNQHLANRLGDPLGGETKELE